MFFDALLLAVTLLTTADVRTPAECATLRRHGQLVEAKACYQALTQATDPYLRAEGNWGLEHYVEANAEFRAATAKSIGNAMYRVRWGRLLHERFNDPEAANLFKEALERDPKNAEAYVGLALVGAEGFGEEARESAQKALQLDPKLTEAHEILAELALQDSDTAAATKEADAALAIAADALDAMAIHAAIDILADRPPDTWLQKMTAVNATYGHGYAIVASHLVLNRRYDDGVAYYRKAVALDPRLWEARSQLGVNLMRLGKADEAREQLVQCYNNGYRNAATVNSLRLLDTLKTFTTLKSDTTILAFDPKEASLLQPYVEDTLKRAIARYSKDYGTALPGPIRVEVYPNHEDFAVRTVGMPGLGALGVTFGTVIAMDSPSGRKPGSFNWAATLWHETNHVFAILASQNRAPRWFLEGLAVHAEGEGDSRWANRMTPDIVVAMRDKKLLPIAALDRGFVREEYPHQVVVSYYQAGRICDFIAAKWGQEKLVDLLHRFAQHDSTPDAIQHALALSPTAFDEQFNTWIYGEAGPIITHFDEWRTRLKHLVELVNQQRFDEAATEADAARKLYPQYVEDANPYAFLADIRLAKEDKAGAIAALADYQKQGGEDPATLKKLAALQQQAGQQADATATLAHVNEIYPVGDEDVHRRLGELWLAQKNYPGAIREYGAVVAMKPLDKAGALYHLAAAYFAARQFDQAEHQVLGALEAAPGYRPAQQLLLQIEDARGKPPQKQD
jgi:tetratricopeptide (TPR) repeat protein